MRHLKQSDYNQFLKHIANLLLLFVVLSTTCWGQQKVAFKPQKGAKIVMLGNTFADRMRHYNYFELLLHKNFPTHQLTFRNMGWSADEVDLQPRPLNFPGITQRTQSPISTTDDLTFRSWGREIAPMPTVLNFDGLFQDLTEQQADIIFLCFGLNEAFRGEEGLADFEKNFHTLIKRLQSQKFNGKSTPQLVLVSPIEHETLGGHYPNPTKHNQSLAMYTATMKKVAEQHALLFIDLYTAASNRATEYKSKPLTINGIHLNDLGYQWAAKEMGLQLGFSSTTLATSLTSNNSQKVKEVIFHKDAHFFYRWRAVNGEYIYGRRREPFGIVSYPPEMKKLTAMTASLDGIIWKMSNGAVDEGYKAALKVIDERGNPEAQKAFLVTDMTGKQSRTLAHEGHHHHNAHSFPDDASSFTLPEGYKINLFASEKSFPIAEAVALSFDAKGRLWVATMPTYPQYVPGVPVHDKIIILEDTNKDGVADKHTVFADNLYLPLGFEFGDGGVYVSQEPDLLFLKDTDGDDVADVREVILSGFGSEDSHHAIHTFTYGQDGALYFNEGHFLNTQVETPYGPVRSYTGATYRFEPRSGKLENYISYPYYNPWGNVFLSDGTHLVGDASDGSNYFAPPMTGKVDYPAKHERLNTFTTTRVRPTAGLEIVSSRNFPPHAQGNLLINNNIGFQGIKQHRVIPHQSGLTSEEVEPLLQSTDPNFRPVDLEFGPDGALYIIDWYNPLISHGENPPRDPARDKTHGRIWRITYEGNPIVTPPAIHRQSIEELFENLKLPEERTRYRTRMALWQKPHDQLLPALQKWEKSFTKNDSLSHHYLVEALWMYQAIHKVNQPLLLKLLQSEYATIRAAATRAIRFWAAELDNPTALLATSIRDASPRVRVEAIAALSHFETLASIEAALPILDQPTDYYIDYAIKETFQHLKPVWLKNLQVNGQLLNAKDSHLASLFQYLDAEELASLPATTHRLKAELANTSTTSQVKLKALAQLTQLSKQSKVSLLFTQLTEREQRKQKTDDLVKVLFELPTDELVKEKSFLEKSTTTSPSKLIRQAALGSLLSLDAELPISLQELAINNPTKTLDYLEGIHLIQSQSVKNKFVKDIKQLALSTPTTDALIDVQLTASKVLFGMSQHEQDKLAVIDKLLGTQPLFTNLLEEFVNRQDSEALATHYAQPIFQKIESYVATTSEKERFEPNFNKILKVGHSLAEYLPKNKQVANLAFLEKHKTVELSLTAVPAQMLFDKKELSIQAGKLAILTFHNPDLMPHNVVITSPNSGDKVGEAADAMANGTDGFEKQFIPTMPEVLFATPLVNTNSHYTLQFKAPSKPGNYPYICSFPGHWRVMKGILKVTP